MLSRRRKEDEDLESVRRRQLED